jgi:hypothetical protein
MAATVAALVSARPVPPWIEFSTVKYYEIGCIVKEVG